MLSKQLWFGSVFKETFQHECQEIGEGVELSVPTNVLISELDAVAYVGV
jgi:hypothetical protein